MRGNSMPQEPIIRMLLTGMSSAQSCCDTAQVKGPFRRVRETRPERNGRAQTRRTRIRPHPIRNDRGSCRRHGRPSNAPCPFVPGRRRSSSSPSGSSSCRSDVLLKMRHGDRQQRDGLLVRVIREHRAHQLLGDFGKDRGRRNRRIERDRASDRVEVGEANAHRHGSTGPGFRPQPGGNPVRKMTQRGSEDPLFRRLLAERRLGSGRSAPGDAS